MMFPNTQSVTEEDLWHLWPRCFPFLEKKSFSCLSAARGLWAAGAAAGGRGEQGAVLAFPAHGSLLQLVSHCKSRGADISCKSPKIPKDAILHLLQMYQCCKCSSWERLVKSNDYHLLAEGVNQKQLKVLDSRLPWICFLMFAFHPVQGLQLLQVLWGYPCGSYLILGKRSWLPVGPCHTPCCESWRV